MGTNSTRSKWAAAGAAVAVTLGAGGIGITHATTSSGEKPIYLPIEPCRLADTRPESQVGTRNVPLGNDETHTLSGWGSVGDCTLPTGTAALSLNVTAVNTTQPTFLALFPAGGDLPNASHLNPQPGQGPVPNAVNVDLDGGGEFSIYNLAGNVDIIIDVVGVYDDHNHDDRYYTETEVDAALGSKANSADVYTKAEAEARYVNLGEVRIRQSVTALQPYFSVASAVEYLGGGARVTSNGSSVISLEGPMWTDGRFYRLEAMTYCISTSGNRYIDRIQIWMNGGDDNVEDGTDRAPSGCYTVDMDGTYSDSYAARFEVSGATGNILFESITTTWVLAPVDFVPPIFPILSLGVADADAPSLEVQSAGG